ANGIMIIVKNAGIATSILSHSISFKLDTINTPTIINAGAVTDDVTIANNGEKNNARKKNSDVKTDVKPVRPPTPTPVADSTNAVVVDVPKTAPTTVADESASKALLARGNSLSFIKPAFPATATNVPAVSKKSTNRNVKIIPAISHVKISPK